MQQSIVRGFWVLEADGEDASAADAEAVDACWWGGRKVQHRGRHVDRHRRYVAASWNQHLERVKTDRVGNQPQHVTLRSQ